jgi:hypothetical protein
MYIKLDTDFIAALTELVYAVNTLALVLSM